MSDGRIGSLRETCVFGDLMLFLPSFSLLGVMTSYGKSVALEEIPWARGKSSRLLVATANLVSHCRRDKASVVDSAVC